MYRNHASPLLPKEQQYYECVRPEVIEEIYAQKLPTQRILELGCSTGATAFTLRQHMACEYYEGLELCAEAAAVAQTRLDKVQVVNLEQASLEELGLAEGSFDLLIGLDVFEHLYDPWATMAKFTQCLKSGGHLVTSFPNTQNITILEGLVNGTWEYEQAGLLDATHIRFFTMKTLNQMIAGCGLEILKYELRMRPLPDMSQVKDEGNTLTSEKFILRNLTREELLQFCAYQYIVTARKP
jgi:O-antigen biosynthesis protein